MNVFDRLNQIARLLETRSGPADADADADASVRPMLSSRSAPVRYAARTVLGLHDTEMDVLPKPQLERQDDEPAALTVTLKRPRSSSSREHARDEERRKRRAAYADAFLKKDAVDTTGPTNDSNDDELSVLNDELLHYAQETCATSLARVVTLLGTMAPRQVARVCGAEGVLHCAKWPDQVLLALWASGAASVWPAQTVRTILEAGVLPRLLAIDAPPPRTFLATIVVVAKAQPSATAAAVVAPLAVLPSLTSVQGETLARIVKEGFFDAQAAVDAIWIALLDAMVAASAATSWSEAHLAVLQAILSRPSGYCALSFCLLLQCRTLCLGGHCRPRRRLSSGPGML